MLPGRLLAIISWRFYAPALAAALVLQLMLPLYPQTKAYFATDSLQTFHVDASWIRNTAAYLWAGAPWAKCERPDRLFYEPLCLKGFKPSLDRIVRKYKPGSAESFDFGAYAGAGR